MADDKDKPGRIGARASAILTGQCIVACITGEFVALSVGVTLGLGTLGLFSLSLVIAYAVVFFIGVIPFMLRRRVGLLTAIKVVGIAETISLTMIEVVKTLALVLFDFAPHGSVLSLMFWATVLSVMLPAYFIAWPANHLALRLLRRYLGGDHHL